MIPNGASPSLSSYPSLSLYKLLWVNSACSMSSKLGSISVIPSFANNLISFTGVPSALVRVDIIGLFSVTPIKNSQNCVPSVATGFK